MCKLRIERVIPMRVFPILVAFGLLLAPAVSATTTPQSVAPSTTIQSGGDKSAEIKQAQERVQKAKTELVEAKKNLRAVKGTAGGIKHHRKHLRHGKKGHPVPPQSEIGSTQK